MGVTTTSQGITAKQVLIGTSGNQIYALDKRFVDPRRPLGKPTKVATVKVTVATFVVFAVACGS